MLSDIPLKWMIEEIFDLEVEDDRARLAFKKTSIPKPAPTISDLNKQLASSIIHKPKLTPSQLRIITGQPHDMLAFGGGVL